MVALWENPTIWLLRERQENLCLLVYSVCVSYEATCACVAVWFMCYSVCTVWPVCLSVFSMWCTSECASGRCVPLCACVPICTNAACTQLRVCLSTLLSPGLAF